MGEWPRTVVAWLSTMFANTQREETCRRYLNELNIKLPGTRTCERFRQNYHVRLAEQFEQLEAELTKAKLDLAALTAEMQSAAAPSTSAAPPSTSTQRTRSAAADRPRPPSDTSDLDELGE